MVGYLLEEKHELRNGKRNSMIFWDKKPKHW